MKSTGSSTSSTFLPTTTNLRGGQERESIIVIFIYSIMSLTRTMHAPTSRTVRVASSACTWGRASSWAEGLPPRG